MNSRNLRRAAMAAVTAALTIPLAACGAGAGAADGSGGGPAKTDLVVGVVTDADHAPDPVMDGSLAGLNYFYNVFDQLTRLGTGGDVESDLATSWKASDDFKTWTYTLRPGVKFTNGEPVTAQDVAFTYDTILKDKNSDNFSYMEQLASVDAPDARTVVFHLNASFSPWPSITTLISIVPQQVYTRLGSAGFAKAPVGSGPFKFVSYIPGVSYVIERNPGYWGKPAKLDKVKFQIVADGDARLNGVESGSLDLALIAPNQVESLAASGAAKLASRESNGVTFLGMNAKAGPLTDPRVRLAISKAVDLNAIAKTVLSGRAVPDSQLVAADVAGYAKDMPNVAYDPAGARKLLAEAGYHGQAIPFQYATDGRIPLSSQVAQAIEGYLSAAGINVKMMGTDQATLTQIIYGNESVRGLYLNTWAPSTMDGDMPVTNMFDGGANDYAKNPRLAPLVTRQRTVSGDARTAVFRQIFAANEQSAQIVGLYTPETDYAVNPDLNWIPRADGEYYLADASFK